MRRFPQFPRAPRAPCVEVDRVKPAVSQSAGEIDAAPDSGIILGFIRSRRIQHYKADFFVSVSGFSVQLISVFAVGGYYRLFVHSRISPQLAKGNPNRNQRTLISTDSVLWPLDSSDFLCHVIRRETGSPMSRSHFSSSFRQACTRIGIFRPGSPSSAMSPCLM